MRHRGPSWLFSLLLLAVLFPLADDCAAAGIPGAETPEQVLMNEYPVLPPDARKKFELTAQDPTAAADLGVSDFFQLVADILKLNIVVADKTKLEGRRVGIVMRDMTIEEAVRLVLQMNDLKAVHFNENTIIVMDQGSKAAYGTKQVQTFRLQHTTIDKLRDFINLNKNIQRQLGDNINFDATNNSIIAVDSSENLALLGMVITQLDVPPAKVLEGVKLSFLDFTQFTALAKTLGTDIVNRLATIGLSYNQQSRQLMVYGTPQDVRLIRNLVAKLDVAPKQVLIDTSFLQVSESFNREFGFKFTNSSISVHQFDRIKDLDRIRAQTDADSVLPTRTQINYLIQKTGAKTLQSPKVRAIDRTAATINIGEIRNIQIQSTATTLGTGLTPGQQQTTFNTQEVPIGVQVNVTPEIHNDDSVTLDMKISVTKVLEIKSFGVDRTTQDSTTKLRIRNGETVVLGGFINQVLNTDDTPLPIIGEIPLLSKIFRNKKRERTDSELVFLLTPYILDFQGKDPNPDPFELKPPAVQAEGPAAQEAPAAASAISIAPTTPLTPIVPLGSAGKSADSSAAAGHASLERGRLPETSLRLDEQVATLPKTVKTTTTRVVESKHGSAKVVFDDGGHVLAKEFTPGTKVGAVDSDDLPELPGETPQVPRVATAMGAPAAKPAAAPRSRSLERAEHAPVARVSKLAPSPVEPSEAIETPKARAEVRMAAAESSARATVAGQARRPGALDAVVRQHRNAEAKARQTAPAPEELDSFRRLVDLAKSAEKANAAPRAETAVVALRKKVEASTNKSSRAGEDVREDDDEDASDAHDEDAPVSLARSLPGPGAGSALGGVRGIAPAIASLPSAPRRLSQARAEPKPVPAAASQGHGTNHPYLQKLREERLKAKAAEEFDAVASAGRAASSRKSYGTAAEDDEDGPAATSLARSRRSVRRATPLLPRVASRSEAERVETAAKTASSDDQPQANASRSTARHVRAAGRVEAAAAAPAVRVRNPGSLARVETAPAPRAAIRSRAHARPSLAVEVEESYTELAAGPQPAVVKRSAASSPATAARPASDRELLARLRSLAANRPEPPATSAASTAAGTTDRDASLRKRLQALTASRATSEEPQERVSGSSFEELARQLERQLGTGGV